MLTGLAAAVAVPAAVVGLIAAPAYSDDGDIEVAINGLDSSMRAGSRDGFSVRLENQTDQTIVGVVRVFTVRADGMSTEGVRISRGGGGEMNGEDLGNGQVRFLDQMSVELTEERSRFDSRSMSYQIQFTSAAPSGRAEVTVEAYVGQERMGADSDSVSIRGGSGNETPTQTPTTDPPTATPPVVVAPPVSLSPIDAVPAAGDGGGGVPLILYVLGAILVTMGGGILWLLLRERTPAAGVAGAGAALTQHYRPSHAAPTQAYPPRPAQPLNPTAILPVVRDPKLPPPPVDPWAQPPGAGPADFDPFNPRP
jgi:hypothetical protein